MVQDFLADVATSFLSKVVSAVADPLILENQALLSDATSSAAGQIWMEDFTDVVRDAGNLLPDVDYHLLRKKIQKHNKVRAKLASFVRGRISASFDDIHRRGHQIGLGPVEITSVPAVQIRRMSATVDESRELVDVVCCCSSSFSPCTSSSSSTDGLSVLAIVGSGDLGKTTLAQLLSKKQEIVKNFGERIWVTVSELSDIVKILNEMMQSLTGGYRDLTDIQAELKDWLTFLLVLNDVWNTPFQVWDTLRSSLIGLNPVETKLIVGPYSDKLHL